MIWEDDALCRYFVGGGFINWAESWLKRMDASSWCSAYTMCAKKARPGFMGEISEMADSCSSCKNFFGDYLAIAKHAPKQFHDIFIQVHFLVFDCGDNKIEKRVSRIFKAFFRSEMTFAMESTRKPGVSFRCLIQELRPLSSRSLKQLKTLTLTIYAKTYRSVTRFICEKFRNKCC